MVFERLRILLAELFSTNEGEITQGTDLYDDLYADSLDMFELSMILEEEFDLSTKDIKQMENFRTVGEITDYILKNKLK